MPTQEPFEFGGKVVTAGSRITVDLPVSVLSDHTPVTMPVHIIHGKRHGPTMFVSAAVHGDEVIGVEIVRRLLRAKGLNALRGTLLVVPIVNAFGFLNHSRYLPDRRDLNRSFPGSAGGSLAARLAHIFLTEVVERSDFGIDLHSAAIHRTNLPQIRVSSGNAETMRLAQAFGAPVILTSKLRDGSLRGEAHARGIDILLYEAGEGLRFDEFAVRAGVSGILRVMKAKEMISGKGVGKARAPSLKCRNSHWMRAPAGGLLRTFKSTGESVEVGDLLGVVSDPFGEVETDVLANYSGIIIGRTNLPIVNEGDAVFHVAEVSSAVDADATMDSLTEQLDEDPMFDEDEII